MSLRPAMSRRRWIAAGAGTCLSACAGPGPGRFADAPPARLPLTHQRDVRDAATGDTWRVRVKPPEGPAPASGHPLLLLLDGNATFALAVQLARNAAARPPGLRPEAMLVVSVDPPVDGVHPGAARQRTLTPPDGPLAAFIVRSLLPALGAEWAIDPHRRTVHGHSFGGLFVLNLLFHHPRAFTRHVAASPSVWWADGEVLDAAERFARERPRVDAAVRLIAGSLERAGRAPAAERSAAHRARASFERTEALAARLSALRWPELRVTFEVEEGADHGAVLLPSLVAALDFAQTTR